MLRSAIPLSCCSTAAAVGNTGYISPECGAKLCNAAASEQAASCVHWWRPLLARSSPVAPHLALQQQRRRADVQQVDGSKAVRQQLVERVLLGGLARVRREAEHQVILQFVPDTTLIAHLYRAGRMGCTEWSDSLLGHSAPLHGVEHAVCACMSTAAC